MSVLDPEIAEFLRQNTTEIFLLFGRGSCPGSGVRLGVDANVTQETLKNGMLECAGRHTDLD